MKKNSAVASAPAPSAKASETDPKAQLKALREQSKALRDQVKAQAAQAKAESKEKSKEVTLRWISNFTARIHRLEKKISIAQEQREKLVARAKENGWLQ